MVNEYSGETQIIIQRGRKSKPTNENYFDQREEMAVRMFLTASTFNERNKIYNNINFNCND